jgi:hypothetical protein
MPGNRILLCKIDLEDNLQAVGGCPVTEYFYARSTSRIIFKKININMRVSRNQFLMGIWMLVSIIFTNRAQDVATETHVVTEWEYTSPREYDNPFREVSLEAIIKSKDSKDSKTIKAFWAGGNSWKFRFSSPIAGQYEFVTRCSDKKNKGFTTKKAP